MPMNRGMKSSGSLDRHFVAVTSMLVLALGAPAVYSLLREPRKVDATLALAEVSGRRQPASVILQKTDVLQEKTKSKIGKSLSIDIACDNRDLGEIQVSHLRLRGVHCGSLSGEVTIKNESNGFTAQVIDLKDKNYTTDFIDLTEGTNQLIISRKGPEGQIQEQKIQVRRLPASINEEEQGQ
jgi:hypothetical protein